MQEWHIITLSYFSVQQLEVKPHESQNNYWMTNEKVHNEQKFRL